VSQLNAAAFAGHNDWRIPTVEHNYTDEGGAPELETIRQGCSQPACVLAPFNRNCVDGCTVTDCSCADRHSYWSAESSRATEYAVYFDYSSGQAFAAFKSSSFGGGAFARAVRGHNSQSLRSTRR
jgi:hypothetical protein